MDDRERGAQDLIVSGSGSASGGVYRMIQINGSARLRGDYDCRDMVINGSASISGSARAVGARVNGSSHISGDLRAARLQVHGSTSIGGDVDAEELEAHGSLKVSRSIACTRLEGRGQIDVRGDVEAEECRIYGKAAIGGLLNAGNIRLDLWGASRIGEIGGDSIRVTHAGAGNPLIRFFRTIFGLRPAGLEAGVIEGDTVSLMHTTADVVRGKTIRIGPGCRIGRIEYLDRLDVEGESEIGERRRL